LSCIKINYEDIGQDSGDSIIYNSGFRRADDYKIYHPKQKFQK